MNNVIIPQRFWCRRDTQSNWESVNPVLAFGEWGIEANDSDQTIIRAKIGDGVTAWASLPYYGGSGSSIYFRRDDLTASAGDNLITIDKSPLPDSLSIHKNRMLSYLSEYSISGKSVSIEDANSGDIFSVSYWSTDPAGASTIGISGDPYWNDVVLRMTFDGNLTDYKGNVMSPYGSVAYGPGVWGDGLTGGGAVSLASIPSLSLVADFTIEFWANMEVASGGGALISLFDSSPVPGWQIYCDAMGMISWYQYDGGGSYPLIATTNSISGQTRFIRVSRDSGLLRMEIDGDLVASTNNSVAYGSTGYRLSIKHQDGGASRYPFTGMIDDLRVTNGVSRFGDPTPTQAFPV